MRRSIRWPIVAVSAAALVAAALPAGAEHKTFPSTNNMHALGHSVQIGTFDAPDGQRVISSDLAFWGKYAFNGNYNGFRVIDISSPANPKLISHPECNGDQGDLVVWGDILVRSWNAPAPAGRTCDGEPVPAGFEGVHVWDISDPSSPEMIAAVEFSQAGAATRGTADGCGSHTATLVPDLDNDRLIIYSNNSSGANRPVCDAMNIIEVPIDDPASASHIGYVPLTGGSLGSNNGCHDAGAILGNVNKLVCASGHAANVFSIGAPGGGTLENPQFLYTIEESDSFGNKVGIGGRWHSAGFTWDGEVIVLGWEPGGGGAAECEATDPDIKKSLFFYDAGTGAKLGQWVLPHPQGADENCTIHNYNIVPLRSGRYVAVGGHYQAGTWAVDFTDPANPVTVGWVDPPTLGPGNFCGGACQIGGAWSSYWYNNFIYESDITRGLNVYRLSDSVTGGAMKLDHMNPQTQEFSL